MKYIFQLGHQPHISHQEIISLLQRRGLSFVENTITDKFLIIESQTEIPEKEILLELGGTIAIGIELPTQKEQEDTLVDALLKMQEGKIQFCINTKNKKLGITIKKRLKELGRSVRYIEYKNTATIFHNNLIEKNGYFLEFNNTFYKIEAIQDLEAFSKRDFDKPGFDTKSGMLPPKLARIMINLAEKNPIESTLLDPFCGSGVLLMEAYDLGYKKIIGTDISSKAIDDANKNIEWIQKEQKNEDVSSIIAKVEDVKDLSQTIEENSVDLIVSEPYMGRPLRGNEREDTLKNQTQELSQLFQIAFREFQKILKDNGTIIFIIPQFRYKNTWITIDCIDEIEKQGFQHIPFSQKNQTLLYSRENQHVGRMIWKFQKK